MGSWTNPKPLYTKILITTPDNTHMNEIMKSDTSKPVLPILIQSGSPTVFCGLIRRQFKSLSIESSQTIYKILSIKKRFAFSAFHAYDNDTNLRC